MPPSWPHLVIERFAPHSGKLLWISLASAAAPLFQVSLNPRRRVMDIDRLQPPRPEILELVGNPRRTEHNFSSRSLKHRIADEEPRPAFDHDERLVIRVHMKPRAHARLVSAISQYGDFPTKVHSGDRPPPRSALSRIEQPR